MSATADHAEVSSGLAQRLGIQPGQVVQEIGYDDDCDEGLRAAIVEATGSELVDEDYDDVVDAVLLWWREDDGDLVDTLVDALTPLTDGGMIWLLTPKAGRVGHVEPSDISEAAPTAGLTQAGSINAARTGPAHGSRRQGCAPQIARRGRRFGREPAEARHGRDGTMTLRAAKGCRCQSRSVLRLRTSS